MNSFDKIPLVSISCITYNHKEFIQDALNGFIMQETNFPFEVLVHDDCSTDGTTDVIREYAEKYPDIIKPLYEQENQYQNGKPYGTRVWNLPRAKGKYIAMCEGDDYWTDPLKLQKQVDFLESHPEYGMCYTRVQYYDQQKLKVRATWGGSNETFEDLLIKNTVPTLTAIIKTDLFRKYHNEQFPDKHNWLMGDYPLWLYVSAISKIKFSPEITGIYRVLSNSASHSSSILQKYRFNKSYKEIAECFMTKYSDRVNNGIRDRFFMGKYNLLLPLALAVGDDSEIKEAKNYLSNRSKSLKLRMLTLPPVMIAPILRLRYHIRGWKK